ncbi:MAG: transposase [Thermodesulfobacteriota bacterium]
MVRPWRIQYTGAIYHVYSRGIEKRNIFYDDGDRQQFLKILGRMADRFRTKIFVYVLMPNHYHLLLKTGEGNLSRSMQWLGTAYTSWFNRRHHRSGHLFQGRFKSILVENNDYLLQLSCYVHRNPVRAGLVKRLAEYKWSSYLAYAYGRAHPKWLNMDFILSQFGEKNTHKAYREKVQSYALEEKKIWEDVRYGLALGTKEFIDRLKENFLKEIPHKEKPQQRKILNRWSTAELLARGAEIFKKDINAFKGGLRIKDSEKEARDLLIFWLWETGFYKNYEIGELFDLGYSSISKRATIAKLALEKNEELRKKYYMLKSLIKM